MLFRSGDIDSLNFNWKFGNGDTSSGESPDYVYNYAGDYTPELFVFSENGCKDTVVKTINVKPNVSADFGITKVNNEKVLFEAFDTTGLKYYWNFGDSGNSNKVNPEHVYDSSGIYVVSLKVYNENGCTNTSTDTIEMFNVGTEYTQGEKKIPFNAYPNPFTNEITIEYELTKTSQVQLEIFTAIGKLVKRPVSGEQESGSYEYKFKDSKSVTSGIYFIKLTVNKQGQVKKIVKAH